MTQWNQSHYSLHIYIMVLQGQICLKKTADDKHMTSAYSWYRRDHEDETQKVIWYMHWKRRLGNIRIKKRCVYIYRWMVKEIPRYWTPNSSENLDVLEYLNGSDTS